MFLKLSGKIQNVEFFMVLLEQGYRLQEYIYGIDVTKIVLLRVVGGAL